MASNSPSYADLPAIDTSLPKALRAPFFLIGLVASMIPVFFIFAWVTVGSWCEDLLRLIGYQNRPRWLPPVAGVLVYAGLGIAGPAVLGHWLVGWPGAILAPLLILGAIAKLGRW